MAKDDVRQRRKALHDLCTALMAQKQARDNDKTVNDVLKDFYAAQGHTDLRTFKQWKDAGYHVRKGEKAILLWARPKATKKSKEAAASAGKDEDEAREDYYPIAYMFSNRQVETNNK